MSGWGRGEDREWRERAPTLPGARRRGRRRHRRHRGFSVRRRLHLRVRRSAAGSRPQRAASASAGATLAPARPPYPPALAPLLEGLADADVFELDERLQRALAREQGLDARIGSLLTVAWERWVHRSLGYATREAYARERLGMDPTRARSLVRLERAAEQNPAFARAYREGAAVPGEGERAGAAGEPGPTGRVRRRLGVVGGSGDGPASARGRGAGGRPGGDGPAGLPAKRRPPGRGPGDRAIGAKRRGPRRTTRPADRTEQSVPIRCRGEDVPARTAGSASSARPMSSSCSRPSCAPCAGVWSREQGRLPTQGRPSG